MIRGNKSTESTCMESHVTQKSDSVASLEMICLLAMGKANNLLYHVTKFSNANKKVLKHNYYLHE